MPRTCPIAGTSNVTYIISRTSRITLTAGGQLAQVIRQDPGVCQLRLLGSPEFLSAGTSGVTGLLAQPKSLAVLAFIALAPPPGYRRRDNIVAVFWPELDQPHARGALRRILHVLRDALGSDLLVRRGVEDIGISERLLHTDVAAFDQACAEGRCRDALAIYRGDLLDGFYLSAASPDFDHWLDQERYRLRRRARRAAEQVAESELAAGNLAGAAEFLSRAVSLFPDDEPQLRRLLRLLSEMGDGAGANRAYQSFADRVATEFDAKPAPETQALIATIRSRTVPRARSSAQSFDPVVGTMMAEGQANAPLAPVSQGMASVRQPWVPIVWLAALLGAMLVISTLAR